MAEHAQKLIETNKRGNVITVIAGKIEEIELPEKVDIIISEPMGELNRPNLLMAWKGKNFNERTENSYL